MGHKNLDYIRGDVIVKIGETEKYLVCDISELLYVALNIESGQPMLLERNAGHNDFLKVGRMSKVEVAKRMKESEFTMRYIRTMLMSRYGSPLDGNAEM